MKVSMRDVFFFGLGVAVILIVFLIVIKITFNPILTNSESESKSYEACGNLSFFKTNHCVNNYIRSIFVYNSSNRKPILDIESLKESGGNCVDWNTHYCFLLNEFGYECNTITLKRAGHMVAISEFRNKTTAQYCLLDQKNIECYESN